MPLTVVCRSCETLLKVGEHLAGKKARCPKCGAILSVPAGADEETVSPAPRRQGRRPSSVEEEERSRRRPRGRVEEEEVDERPVRRSRRRQDDDEEDDRPVSRRRRDDDYDEDDRPVRRPRRKQGSKTLLFVLLGAGGLLVLLCAGGGIGAWLLLRGSINPNVTKANFNLLKTGMTQAQVEQVLGSGRRASADDLVKAFNGSTQTGMHQLTVTHDVYIWKNGMDNIFVDFGEPGRNSAIELLWVTTAPDGFDAEVHYPFRTTTLSRHGNNFGH